MKISSHFAWRGRIHPAIIMTDYLVFLLNALRGVHQDPVHHPEGDALYHSLQAFDLAWTATADASLLAAALFHDVGKAGGDLHHAERGAADLEGLLPERAVLLVRHHMDLVHQKRRVKRCLQRTDLYQDLLRLRRWDMDARNPFAAVLTPEEAVDRLMSRLNPFTHGGLAAINHE